MENSNDFFEDEPTTAYVVMQKLFSSNHKFLSKSGWPSFFKAIDDNVIKYTEDNLMA